MTGVRAPKQASGGGAGGQGGVGGQVGREFGWVSLAQRIRAVTRKDPAKTPQRAKNLAADVQQHDGDRRLVITRYRVVTELPQITRGGSFRRGVVPGGAEDSEPGRGSGMEYSPRGSISVEFRFAPVHPSQLARLRALLLGRSDAAEQLASGLAHPDVAALLVPELGDEFTITDDSHEANPSTYATAVGILLAARIEADPLAVLWLRGLSLPELFDPAPPVLRPMDPADGEEFYRMPRPLPPVPEISARHAVADTDQDLLRAGLAAEDPASGSLLPAGEVDVAVRDLLALYRAMMASAPVTSVTPVTSLPPDAPPPPGTK